jgi:hypothetical protein
MVKNKKLKYFLVLINKYKLSRNAYTMSIYSSIYIPRMSIIHTEDFIRHVMEYHRIGKVEYVDFTPINKKPGFTENVSQFVKSAFVHFSEHYIPLPENKSYRLQITPDEYWICLKNRNPIQRTMMNVHQIAENGRHLEKVIESQAKTIESLEKKIEAVHLVVYQLLGGLFHQDEQCQSLTEHLNLLMNRTPLQETKDISKWNTWPTTRQGDECEKRIAELEKSIKDRFKD